MAPTPDSMLHVFDLDGTLADTAWLISWERWITS